VRCQFFFPRRIAIVEPWNRWSRVRRVSASILAPLTETEPFARNSRASRLDDASAVALRISTGSTPASAVLALGARGVLGRRRR